MLDVEVLDGVVRCGDVTLRWDDALACWPGDPLGGSFEERRDSALGRELRARRGTRAEAGCSGCGAGPVVQRERVDAVHPASGDGYGVMQERCLSCGAFREWAFSDN